MPTPRLPALPASRRLAATATCFGLAAAASAAPLELYEEPGFQGMALGLDRPLAQLADYGFDNRARSVLVRSGQWELCSEPGWRGQCLVLGPGQHAELPPALQRQISSARPHAGVPDVPGSPVDDPVARAPVVLYNDGGFRGPGLPVDGPVPSLGEHGMGDRVSSVEVRRGQWQLCKDSGYRGQCIVLGPGRHHLSGPLHDEASSIRPVFGPSQQPLPPHGGLTLYEHSNFSGRELMVTTPVEYLGRLGFGDSASAVEVHAGLWQFCTDSMFRGRCITLGPGRHTLTGTMQDRLSSVRPALPDRGPAWKQVD